MSKPVDQHSSQEPASSQTQTPPPAIERAEFLVDAVGVRLEQWTSNLGDTLQRLWARTREEGEDIWAEAQDIRHRTHIGTGTAGDTARHPLSSGEHAPASH